LGNGGATQGATKDADESDAHLNGGKEIVRRIGKPEGISRLSIASIGKLTKS
jgi:hypothetical protein